MYRNIGRGGGEGPADGSQTSARGLPFVNKTPNPINKEHISISHHVWWEQYDSTQI